MHIPTAFDSGSTDILAAANTPILWICALGVFAVIIVQTLIYVRAVRQAAPAVGMTSYELKTSFRTGAVSAIGRRWPWCSWPWPC